MTNTNPTGTSGEHPSTGARDQGHCCCCASSRPECLCAGSGPALSGVVSELVRRYGPSPEARQHFQAARLEILKGLRAVLDERIGDIQQPDSSSAPRGSKVTVE